MENIWIFLKPAIEISILWVGFYRVLVFFEGTRAYQVLKGLWYFFVAFIISEILGLDTLNWLLARFFAISILALLIIFQQEIRHGLARLGQQHLFTVSLAESEIVELVEEIASAVFKMSKQNIGCLIALERQLKLTTYEESGIVVDAKLNAELLQSIFNPQAPMHDGGVIIRGDRILAVSCLFPLSENPSFSKITGTRHRAALGLAEQTDAVVAMVSEETGHVALAYDGKFIPINEKEELVKRLMDILYPEQKQNEKIPTA